MNTPADMMLFWLTHQRQVSERVMRSAVDSLLYDFDEKARLRSFHTIRKNLVLLAHALSEKGSLRITAPCLLLLPGSYKSKEGVAEAVFAGARTPRACAEWKHIAVKNKCLFAEDPVRMAPMRISLSGSITAIENAAIALGIPLIHNASLQALKLAPDLEAQAQTRIPSQTPSGVTPEVYDMMTLQWIPGDPKTYDACRYKPTHAAPSYFIQVPEGFVQADDGGQAVSIAAHLQGHSLCAYDAETCQFTAPREFPNLFARALCLCSGLPPKAITGNNLRYYSDVVQPIAHATLKRLGQISFSPALSLSEVDACPPLIRWLD